MVQRIAREPDYTWIYMNESRNNFDMKNHKRFSWVERRPDSYNKEVLFTAVADMAIIKYGDIFLGAFTSHFSKVLLLSIRNHVRINR
jgi:hypothetical protein